MLAEVLHLRTIFRRTIERRFGHAFVGNRNAEPRAELAQLVFVELLLVVRDVAAFAAFAQAVALDRFGEDHGRPAFAFDGRLVGRVDFFRVVAAAAHLLQLFVRVRLHHLGHFGILAEEIFANVVARRDDVLLVLAVDHFHHALLQQAGFIGIEQRIPVVAPDDLDDVPTGAAERAFELLNNLAVAAHRAIEPLQIAVDDEDQVVELFARGERDRAERFGLVAFAVAHETPTRACAKDRRCRDRSGSD